MFTGGGTGGRSGGGGKRLASRPRFLMCYICGREYGTKSLSIHQEQCKALFLKREALKPRSERRPLPRKPTLDVRQGGGGRLSIDAIEAHNAAAYNTFENEAMARCPNCDRTFNADRLPVHLRSCKPGKTARRVGDRRGVQCAGAGKSGTGTLRAGRSSDSQDRPLESSPSSRKGYGRQRNARTPGSRGRPNPNPRSTSRSPSNDGSSSYNNQSTPTRQSQQKATPFMPTTPGTFCTNCGAGGLRGNFCGHCGAPRDAQVYSPQSHEQDHTSCSPFSTSANDNDQKTYSPLNRSKQRNRGRRKGTKTAKAAKDYTNSQSNNDQDSEDDDDWTAQRQVAQYSIPNDAVASTPPDGLVACRKCSRNFNKDRINKHESVCKGPTKRLKARGPNQMPSATASPQSRGDKSKTNWRSKHTDFQNAIKYAKKLTAMQKAGVNLASLPPPPRSENPDYVQCPHCTRRFAPLTAERHIPKCATTVNKAAPPPKVNRYANRGSRSLHSSSGHRHNGNIRVNSMGANTNEPMRSRRTSSRRGVKKPSIRGGGSGGNGLDFDTIEDPFASRGGGLAAYGGQGTRASGGFGGRR